MKMPIYVIIPFSFVILFFLIAINVVIREEIFKKYIISQAIEGNKVAVAIIQKYDNPSGLPHHLVKAAIEGNPHAAEALELNEQ